MPSETTYFYQFKDNVGVNVLSYVNNVYAAKMAMLKTYGRKESDIMRYSALEKKGAPVFDGRSFH